MKKPAAILLIAVLFFNWYGYRLLTGYRQQRADRQLEARLNNNDYDESQLIPIKIPVTALTYYEASDEWERIDGEMILGDVAYKYVKRRIHNDSIELLCIRNTAEMQLGEAGNAFFRLVNNLAHLPGQKTTGASDIHKIYTPARLVLRVSPPAGFIGLTQVFVAPVTAPGFPWRMERPPAMQGVPG